MRQTLNTMCSRLGCFVHFTKNKPFSRRRREFIISVKDVRCFPPSVVLWMGLFVCLSAGLHRNYWMDFHKTLAKRETITFATNIFFPTFFNSATLPHYLWDQIGTYSCMLAYPFLWCIRSGTSLVWNKQKNQVTARQEQGVEASVY